MMYIKSIVLEGFKYYAQRTEIHAFDPLFNAITGLNGSCKSNILDSICFVLGISNLSQVRASNLQDLVYKSGQAGITKATVSIIFDNSDKSRSPLGFEANDEFTVTRQVVVGGRSKYLINGVNAANSRVQDLFSFVGLSINNPHFFIMQGQITKVLNMKPPEEVEIRNKDLEGQLSDLEQHLEKCQNEQEAFCNNLKTLLEILDGKIFELTELRDNLAKLTECS